MCRVALVPILLPGDTGCSCTHRFSFWWGDLSRALAQGCLLCAWVFLSRLALLFSCNWQLLDFLFACLCAGKPSEVVREARGACTARFFPACYYYYILL